MGGFALRSGGGEGAAFHMLPICGQVDGREAKGHVAAVTVLAQRGPCSPGALNRTAHREQPFAVLLADFLDVVFDVAVREVGEVCCRHEGHDFAHFGRLPLGGVGDEQLRVAWACVAQQCGFRSRKRIELEGGNRQMVAVRLLQNGPEGRALFASVTHLQAQTVAPRGVNRDDLAQRLLLGACLELKLAECQKAITIKLAGSEKREKNEDGVGKSGHEHHIPKFCSQCL